MERIWYAYISGDPYQVSSYFRVTIKPTFLCGDRICAINAPDNGQSPADPLSNNLQRYIHDGLETGMYQPEKPLNAKAYVYLRD